MACEHFRPVLVSPESASESWTQGIGATNGRSREELALGLLSKAAGGDRPPFIALTRGSGFSVRACQGGEEGGIFRD